jgi:hypothetical protein
VKKTAARPAPAGPRLRSDVAVVAAGAAPAWVPEDVRAAASSDVRADAFNRGLEEASEPFLILVDGGEADVDAAVRFLREHPGAGLAGPGAGEQATERVDASCLAVRRRVLERIGGLDAAALPPWDGEDLAARCRRAGFEVWTTPALKAAPAAASGWRARFDRARSWSELLRKRGRGLRRLAHPLRWLLSLFSKWSPGPRQLRLRDGWTVDERHLEAFADFDRAVEKIRSVREEGGGKVIEVTAGERGYVVRTRPRGGWASRIAAILFGARAPRVAEISRRVVASGVPCAPVVAGGDRNYGKAWVAEQRPPRSRRPCARIRGSGGRWGASCGASTTRGSRRTTSCAPSSWTPPAACGSWPGSCGAAGAVRWRR